MILRYKSIWDKKIHSEDFVLFIDFWRSINYASKCSDIMKDTMKFACLNCGDFMDFERSISKRIENLPYFRRRKAMFLCKECLNKELKLYAK